MIIFLKKKCIKCMLLMHEISCYSMAKTMSFEDGEDREDASPDPQQSSATREASCHPQGGLHLALVPCGTT